LVKPSKEMPEQSPPKDAWPQHLARPFTASRATKAALVW